MSQKMSRAHGDGQFSVTTETDVGLDSGWIIKLLGLLFKGIAVIGKKSVAAVKEAKKTIDSTTSTAATTTESQTQPTQNENV